MRKNGIIFSILMLGTVIAFQNCSDVGFKKIKKSENVSQAIDDNEEIEFSDRQISTLGDLTVEVGQTASFFVSVVGGDPAEFITYSWRKNGTELGVTSSNLDIQNAQLTDSGVYSVDIFVDGGLIAMRYAQLTVNPPPVLFTSVEYTIPGDYMFEVPAGIDRVRVTLVGGGGGGDPSNALCFYTVTSGGGGGSVIFEMDVTEGQQIDLTVGAGGIAGKTGTGCNNGGPSNGGDTTFGTVAVAEGGTRSHSWNPFQFDGVNRPGCTAGGGFSANGTVTMIDGAGGAQGCNGQCGGASGLNMGVGGCSTAGPASGYGGGGWATGTGNTNGNASAGGHGYVKVEVAP